MRANRLFDALVPGLLWITIVTGLIQLARDLPAWAQEHRIRSQLPLVYPPIGKMDEANQYYLEGYLLPVASSGPTQPAWSPDGNKIAFAMHGSIWLIPTIGGTATQVTAGPGYEFQPSWSPDGKFICFTSQIGIRWNIYIVPSDGGQPLPLTNGDFIDLDPRWSPDGKTILFSSNRKGNLNLWRIPAAGGEPKQITYGPFNDIQPSWSPDNHRIIFVSTRNAVHVGSSGGVWEVTTSGEEPKPLLYEETRYRTSPGISPDGKRIAFVSSRSGFNDLWLAPIGGREAVQLTFDKADQFAPSWSPDGTQIVLATNKYGVTNLSIISAYGGESKDVNIERLNYLHPMGKLKVRILEGNKRIPARVYLRASDGRSYVPPMIFQRISRYSGDYYFYSDGQFEVQLPAGKAEIEVVRGFEYEPTRNEVVVAEGKEVQLTLHMKRLIHMPDRGWFSGDNHVHMNYGGEFLASPTDLMLMAQAEDLNVVNDLIANMDTRFPDLEYFEGRPNRLSTTRHLLYFNEEYRAFFYGHMGLLNLKKLVYPLFTSYPRTPHASSYPTNTAAIAQAQRQGGVAGYVHPFALDPNEADWAGARALPVDVALRRVDFLEVACAASDEIITSDIWYKLLNSGFKVPASAGTDAMTNVANHVAVGADRVYVKTTGPFSYRNWIRGLVEGKTFVTTGPILLFNVNGNEPGSEIRVRSEKPVVLNVEVEVYSIVPIDRIEVISKGKVVKALEPQPDSRRLQTKIQIEISESTWLAARVLGKSHPLVMDKLAFAHSSPVYVYIDEDPIRSSADARYFVNWIERHIALLHGQKEWNSVAEKNEAIAIFQKAKKVYESLEQDARRQAH